MRHDCGSGWGRGVGGGEIFPCTRLMADLGQTDLAACRKGGEGDFPVDSKLGIWLFVCVSEWKPFEDGSAKQETN